jgi:hypothetical protein
MSKSVRFNPVDTIIVTYSADEYDRSCFASAMPIAYTFRPAVTTLPPPITAKQVAPATSRPVIKPLDLSVIPNSRRRILDSPVEKPVKQSKKPKLSINTQSLTPLFFTELSTHYKCKNEDDEEEHGFLIPAIAC